MIRSLPPASLVPANEVHDRVHFEALVASMREHGWRGRPVLALPRPEGIRAVTSSHRIAAAVVAAVASVPTYVSPVRSDELLPKFGQHRGWFAYFAHHGDAVACALVLAEMPPESQLP